MIASVAVCHDNLKFPLSRYKLKIYHPSFLIMNCVVFWTKQTVHIVKLTLYIYDTGVCTCKRGSSLPGKLALPIIYNSQPGVT